MKVTPCRAPTSSLVLSPLPSKPISPSFSTSLRAASLYPIESGLVCFRVFSTRSEFDTVSDTRLAARPIKAFCRGPAPGPKKAWRVLKVRNHGKWPTAVAEAAAQAPCQSTPRPSRATFLCKRCTAPWPSACKRKSILTTFFFYALYTCKVVFTVSMGMMNILHPAETREAAAV